MPGRADESGKDLGRPRATAHRLVQRRPRSVPAPPHRADAETARARRAAALGALGGVGERLDAEKALLRLGVAQ